MPDESSPNRLDQARDALTAAMLAAGGHGALDQVTESLSDAVGLVADEVAEIQQRPSDVPLTADAATWAHLARVAAETRRAREAGDTDEARAARKRLVRLISGALILDMTDDEILDALQAGDPSIDRPTYRWLLSHPITIKDIEEGV